MSMQINMIEKKIVCFIINIMKGKRFVIALNLVQQVLWVDWKLTYKKQDSSKHVYSLILKCTRWLHFPLNSLQNCFDILVIWTFVFNSVVQTIHFVDVTMKRTRRYLYHLMHRDQGLVTWRVLKSMRELKQDISTLNIVHFSHDKNM